MSWRIGVVINDSADPERKIQSMKKTQKYLMVACVLGAFTPLAGFPLRTPDSAISLGTAGGFSVLAGSTVTNTGLSIIDGGNIGVSPGSSITGFPPGFLAPPFTMHSADGDAPQAQNDMIAAYIAASDFTPTMDLTGQNLGGLTLFPGVYSFSSSAQLTGTLTLDNLGDPNAQFVFQIGSTLTTAINSMVTTINGGSMQGCTAFWQVGSSATIGAGSTFAGHVLALTSITMNTGADILNGSALAHDGAVTLDSNTITNCIPEPGTMTLALIGGALLSTRRMKGKVWHSSMPGGA